MAINERERRRRKFEDLLVAGNLTTADAAGLLHSSKPRVVSWRRKEGAPGANPVPLWAIELLQFKIEQLKLDAAHDTART